MQLSTHTPASGRKLDRLFRIGLPELVCRGRQETFKLVDRLRPPVERRSSPDRQSLERVVANAATNFFPGPFDRELTAALTARAPHDSKALLVNADETCRGRFDLFGYRGLELGQSPDWHRDPISNRRAPVVHWSRLNVLDATTIGDTKVIWELNRHQWLIQLAQAYHVTRDERYAETAVRHLRDWLRANPSGIGVNWASSLEVAFRLIAWCWTLLLIRDSRVLTPTLFAELVASVEAHATHVERYLSYYFSPNTHLTGEALGLFYAALVFPELKRAARWRSLAAAILVQEIERQVLSDGVYFERSTCYQRYTIDIYLHFLVLAERAQLELPPIVADTVKSMLEVLITLRNPDGSMPSIGDADGGMLLPLSRTRPDDYRATFATAAVVFNDPVYAWAAGQLPADTLWLLGTRAVAIFDDMVKTRPVSDKCRVFPEGGFTVMRSGWDEKAHSLIFDAGPLGCHLSAGHGHADLLSIQCSAFGQQYLVDAGTGCYTGDSELRNFFRTTPAHSTVMVDGKSQSEPAGPFSWQSRCEAQLHRWVSNESFAYADAEHGAYGTLPDPVTHRRRVAFVKSRYWIIIDDLTALDTHRVDVRFQFAPMKLRIDDAGWIRATHNNRQGLLLRAFTSTRFDVAVREGQRDPMEGWISPDYGQIERAPAVVFTATARFPLRVVTLLWPSENIDQSPRVEAIRDAHGRPAALTFRDRRETILFDDSEPVIFYQS